MPTLGFVCLGVQPIILTSFEGMKDSILRVDESIRIAHHRNDEDIHGKGDNDHLGVKSDQPLASNATT